MHCTLCKSLCFKIPFFFGLHKQNYESIISCSSLAAILIDRKQLTIFRAHRQIKMRSYLRNDFINYCHSNQELEYVACCILMRQKFTIRWMIGWALLPILIRARRKLTSEMITLIYQWKVTLTTWNLIVRRTETCRLHISDVIIKDFNCSSWNTISLRHVRVYFFTMKR